MKDKRDVMMLTTYHLAKVITVNRRRRQREKKKASVSCFLQQLYLWSELNGLIDVQQKKKPQVISKSGFTAP